MDKLIAITTDFGDQFATAQLKAVLASLGFNGELIENHHISAFSIIEGAFAIDVLSQFVPKGSVLMGVVDPGVGSARRGIIIKSKHLWFVGPDNGLLYPAAVRDGIEQVWQIKENHISPEVARTFHGRDVFIKVAVYLAEGKSPEAFGSRKINSDSLEHAKFDEGQVLHIDSYGNIKVYWSGDIEPNHNLEIRFNGSVYEVPVVNTFADVELGQPLAYLGSSGTLELAVNQGRADHIFKVKPGSLLAIREKEKRVAKNVNATLGYSVFD